VPQESVCAYLAGGVDDIAVILDAFVLDALGEYIFDRRIVCFDKVALSKLNDKRGLPCGAMRASFSATWISRTDRTGAQDCDFPLLQYVAHHEERMNKGKERRGGKGGVEDEGKAG
jgi:hypothetical protein